ncbi:Hypothetical protein PHPALM_5661 [Phytophthora palmivora]|uniref:Uncharacterized protein n=1 Tax=Phytophthora palmivora TaxID=4796 RepID=A0A2P4YGT6_9STRA|nr:Hypothetical protein PHPALM_5661 [Phytophthora palmivora]
MDQYGRSTDTNRDADTKRLTPWNLPPDSAENSSNSHSHNERICMMLLRSRLQQIRNMQEKLELMSKYSLKLLNAQDEFAALLSQEKEDTLRLAAEVGASTNTNGYVMSYAVALENCCNTLLHKD